MRRCEYKKRYNPRLGKHVYNHIYGGGIFDPIKRIAAKMFGKTTKKMATEAAVKATTTALNKTGNYIGNKGGDKIIQLLQKSKTPSYISPNQSQIANNNAPLTQYEINERVQRILSGGKIQKLKI